jgi:hypothetical protein
VGAEHWASLKHVALQVWLATLQNGLPGTAVQSRSSSHWTHVLVGTSQTGVAVALHAALSVTLHCLHWPATHAGLVASKHAALWPEPRSPLHAVHVSLTQIGSVAGQFAFVRQLTQWFVPVSQKGVAPVHAVVSPVLHCTHAPVPRHAGSAAVLHACDAPEPKSPLQPTHVSVVVSQLPVLPVHAVVLQFGDVAVEQHWTQPPSKQIGKPAGQSAFVEHGPQPWLMQTGRPGGHSLASLQT